MLPLPQAAWQRDWCWERRGCDSSSACLRYRAHCTGCSSWSAGYSSLQKQCQNKIMDYIKQMHWYQMSWSIYVEIGSPSSTCTLFTKYDIKPVHQFALPWSWTTKSVVTNGGTAPLVVWKFPLLLAWSSSITWIYRGKNTPSVTAQTLIVNWQQILWHWYMYTHIIRVLTGLGIWSGSSFLGPAGCCIPPGADIGWLPG